MKKNYKMLIIASLLCLVPLIYVLYFYNSLPQTVPTHFDFKGNANGYSKKTTLIFLPIIFSALTLFAGFFTLNDPRLKNKKNTMVLTISIYMVALLCNLLIPLTILKALNKPINITTIISIFISIFFIILGNYLPKCERNYTIGIRTPWTMHSDEIWNKTHRLAGKLFVIGGFIIILSTFFFNFLFIPVIIIFSIIPALYSFYLYKKEN